MTEIQLNDIRRYMASSEFVELGRGFLLQTLFIIWGEIG